MQTRPGVTLASLSDVGCQRENNEDRFSYWEPDSDEEFSRKGRLAVVADGMGGHEGGQEASRIAVEAIEETYAEATEGDPQTLLVTGFRIAHERIQDYATVHPELHGMGTTASAIAILDRRLYYAHVGDSRLYRVRAGAISRLTHDHSYVGRLVESGLLTAEEAEIHPQRHILTAALGAGTEVTPEVPAQPITLQTGDTLILCTDGMWSLLTDAEIESVATANAPLQACRLLVKMTKDRGGPDNITVQIIRFG